MPDQTGQLVFLPGWGFDARIFTDLASILTEQYKREVKILDLPCCGDGKDETLQPAGLDAMAVPLMKLLPVNTILVGWSLGGMASIRLATRSIHNVATVILLASTPCFVNKQDWPHGVDKWQLNRMSRQLQTSAGTHKVLRDFCTIVAMGDRHPKKTAVRLQSFLHSGDPDRKCLLHGLEVLGNDDLRSDIKRLTCRLVMLLAENDRLIARSAGAAMKELCPSLQLDFIPQTGHAPFISDVHRTADLVNRYAVI